MKNQRAPAAAVAGRAAQPFARGAVPLAMSKSKSPAARKTSTRQIASNAVKGGPKSVKKDKRVGAGRGQKG
jgi:hypothetical protein